MMPRETSEDAITQEELDGRAEPASSSVPNACNKSQSTEEEHDRPPYMLLLVDKSKNLAVIAMMKRKNSEKDAAVPAKRHSTFAGRDGLGIYTRDPKKVNPAQMIYFNKDVSAIRDSYPKSSVHALLLPTTRTLEHPFEAFEDAEFLAMVRKEAKTLKSIVASELRKRYSKFSEQEKDREEFLIDLPDDVDMPEGRDWEKEVKVGIHAHPSMNHLHVHVISVDRFSECMKHRKHYNSFATPFFIDLDDFPLAKDDERRTHKGYLDSDLICWRCGKNFGNKFARLKEHLAEEFEKWKAE